VGKRIDLNFLVKLLPSFFPKKREKHADYNENTYEKKEIILKLRHRSYHRNPGTFYLFKSQGIYGGDHYRGFEVVWVGDSWTHALSFHL
jgi:hypothetical protein